MAVPTIITTNATPPPITPDLPEDPLSAEVGLDTMMEEAPPPVSTSLQASAG